MDQTSKKKRAKPCLSLAEKTGLAAGLSALLLCPLDVRLIALPLGIFLLLCAIAPFFPAFSFFLPIVSKGRTDRPAVALTFDDGPDPVTTPVLLEVLAAHQATATFFVTGCKALQYPHLIREIVARGHTIGNHSHSHDNFIMFKSHQILVGEIQAAQQIFLQLGIVPAAFRPPVGITNSRLAKALDETGMFIVNFSRRAGDRGNRRVRHLSRRILKRLRWGDIIMLHDTQPRKGNLLPSWRDEIERVLNGIHQRGIAIVPLATLIERPVMKCLRESEGLPHSSAGPA